VTTTTTTGKKPQRQQQRRQRQRPDCCEIAVVRLDANAAVPRMSAITLPEGVVAAGSSPAAAAVVAEDGAVLDDRCRDSPPPVRTLKFFFAPEASSLTLPLPLDYRFFEAEDAEGLVPTDDDVVVARGKEKKTTTTTSRRGGCRAVVRRRGRQRKPSSGDDSGRSTAKTATSIGFSKLVSRIKRMSK